MFLAKFTRALSPLRGEGDQATRLVLHRDIASRRSGDRHSESEGKNILQIQLRDRAVLADLLQIDLVFVADDGDEFRPAVEMFAVEAHDVFKAELLDFFETRLAGIDRDAEPFPIANRAGNFAEA